MQRGRHSRARSIAFGVTGGSGWEEEGLAMQRCLQTWQDPAGLFGLRSSDALARNVIGSDAPVDFFFWPCQHGDMGEEHGGLQLANVYPSTTSYLLLLNGKKETQVPLKTGQLRSTGTIAFGRWAGP